MFCKPYLEKFQDKKGYKTAKKKDTILGRMEKWRPSYDY